jgi:uncharacterized glyoxalase superfamily protein PhnB
MNLTVTEIKAFVPSKDFESSKRFYKELGFIMASDGDGVAYFHVGHASFLLQDGCPDTVPSSEMMHLLVQDVDAWWKHIASTGLVQKYGVKVTDIELQPWRMRDFCLSDPSGVVWRIGQNVE